MLEPDVRLVSTIPNWNAATKLSINSGVKIVAPTRWNEVIDTFQHKDELIERERKAGRRTRGFVTAARAVGGIYPPKEDWRALRNDELDLVLGITNAFDVHSTVQVLKAPANVIELARGLIEPHVRAGKYEFEEGLMDIGAEHLGTLIEMTDAWLAEHVLTHKGWAMFSLRAGLPGRLIASGWQGLHIDLYGPRVRDQLESRYNGSRLVVNLGDEIRHVVFINLRLATMIRRHPEIVNAKPFREATSAAVAQPGAQGMIANAFMEAHPDYPVIRLTLEPGEGYIAPTTVFPHDGYLAGKRDQDLTLLAGHKGDSGGPEWQPPDYLAAWTDLCLDVARRQGTAAPDAQQRET
jgi:hypothetical protein